MKGAKGLAILFVIIAVLCTIFAVSTYEAPPPRSGAMVAPAQIEVTCYIQYACPLDEIFKEPFEKGVFVFKDLRMFVFTNNLANAVIYPDFVSIFKKFNLKLEDCILQVHNHLAPSTFSDADKKFVSYLRDHGFNGMFALYIQPTKEVKFLK